MRLLPVLVALSGCGSDPAGGGASASEGSDDPGVDSGWGGSGVHDTAAVQTWEAGLTVVSDGALIADGDQLELDERVAREVEDGLPDEVQLDAVG